MRSSRANRSHKHEQKRKRAQLEARRVAASRHNREKVTLRGIDREILEARKSLD
jgi:hypothetical protein